MPSEFLIELTSVTPFQPLDDIPNAIWTYSLSWSDSNWLSFIGLGEDDTGARVALEFSHRINIQDPGQFANVPEIQATKLERPTQGDVQYVYREFQSPPISPIIFSFIGPAVKDSFCPVKLVHKVTVDSAWVDLAFKTSVEGDVAFQDVMSGPAIVCPSILPPGGPAHGRPAADFVGTLPYASEIFGVYQPLAGWLGRRTTQRMTRFDPSLTLSKPFEHTFSGREARMASNEFLRGAVAQLEDTQAVLSPVGLVTLFREYFFEFDNFLGAPSGHLWISPGGTVEVVESSTRRTLVERTAAQSEESTYKVEESLTSQDDVADAVKEDNANDTKLGASASAGAKFAGIYQADASASFSNQATTHKSSEVTHKHTRTQSARVSSEIHRNFKTTFKTVTETTDVTSRRYVVQNTTNQLVNYELRRKMRKVGVQVQHIGTRLSWQVFLDTPGTNLGLGELVHVVAAPDLSSLKKPEPPPPLQPKDTEFAAPFTLQRFPGTKNDPHQDANYTRSGETPPLTGMHSDNNDDHIVGDFEYNAPPPAPGYTIDSIRSVSAKTQAGDAQYLAHYDWLTGSAGKFTVRGQFLNFGGGRIITFTVAITWKPPSTDPAQAQYQTALTDYNKLVAELQRKAYGAAIRDRMKMVSEMRPRPSEDLRKEERQTVYGKLIRELQLIADPHISSELIRQIFDVDEMLYFAAPDYWRPRPVAVPAHTSSSVGRYPVPPAPVSPATVSADPLEGETVVSWYSHTDKDNTLDPIGTAQPEWRIDYLITEDTKPAPFGSSLGWLIEIDGDERRNEFLNAAWVKAVLPIRAGHELEALDWLAQAKVEGEAGLGQPYPFQPGDPANYQGKTLGDVLQLLATDLQAANTDIKNTLATEKVFETGFDPLGTGFRPAEPYMIFDEWLEVLPTDQVVAVEVKYDPKTGQQI
jgi:hypothetical protein